METVVLISTYGKITKKKVEFSFNFQIIVIVERFDKSVPLMISRFQSKLLTRMIFNLASTTLIL